MGGPVPMRERTRRAVRAEIRAAALPLFEQVGFRTTTIERIARESGISVRTFFRYFETKEDVLVGDPDEQVDALSAAFADQPGDTPVWSALRRALSTVARESHDPDALRTSVLIASHAELRARHLEKRSRWSEALTPTVADRLDGPPARRELQAAAIVGSALACFDAATAEWTRTGGADDLAALLGEAMRSVGELDPPS